MALAVTVAAAVIGGVGWFLLSWLVMDTAVGDAAGEGVGVAFGVLIVVSVLGVLRSSRTLRAAESADSTDSGEDPESSS